MLLLPLVRLRPFFDERESLCYAKPLEKAVYRDDSKTLHRSV
jgi:hypothetical protein